MKLRVKDHIFEYKSFFLKYQNRICYYQQRVNPAQDVLEKLANKYNKSSTVCSTN